MSTTATHHDPDCDGYGASHSPQALRRDDGTYEAGCTAGCALNLIGSSEQPSTALAAARQHDHPWDTFDVCTGCGRPPVSFPAYCPGCGLYTVYQGAGYVAESEWSPDPIRLCDDCGPTYAEAVPVEGAP